MFAVLRATSEALRQRVCPRFAPVFAALWLACGGFAAVFGHSLWSLGEPLLASNRCIAALLAAACGFQ
eukprot:8161898-Alexandrium_andersonii.AAC.1